MRLTNWLSVLALSGGAAGLVLVAAFSMTGWGEPGTDTYETYEMLNRLMAVALIFMSVGWIGVWRQMSGFGRWGYLIGFIGTLLIALGTAAEFWLFSDLSYSGPSMRQTAYSTASIGGLVQDIGAMIAGIALWRLAPSQRWLAICLLLALPIDFLAFFTIGSPFFVSTLFAFLIGWILLTNSPRFGVKSLPTS